MGPKPANRSTSGATFALTRVWTPRLPHSVFVSVRPRSGAHCVPPPLPPPHPLLPLQTPPHSQTFLSASSFPRAHARTHARASVVNGFSSPTPTAPLQQNWAVLANALTCGRHYRRDSGPDSRLRQRKTVCSHKHRKYLSLGPCCITGVSIAPSGRSVCEGEVHLRLGDTRVSPTAFPDTPQSLL